MTTRIFLIAFFLFYFIDSAYAFHQGKLIQIEPRSMPEVQDLFRRIAKVEDNTKPSEGIYASRKSLEEYKARTKGEILIAVNNNTEVLVGQMLIFLPQAKTMFEGMLLGVIMQICNLTEIEVVEATFPYIHSQDEEIRKYARLIVYGYFHKKDSKEIHSPFYGHEEYLLQHKDAMPLSLIKYMYELNPDMALESMARVSLPQKKADAYISDLPQDRKAPAFLLQMTESEYWWANYYSAVMMVQNEKLRSGQLIRHLEKSKHPLVIDALKELEKDVSSPKNTPDE